MSPKLGVAHFFISLFALALASPPVLRGIVTKGPDGTRQVQLDLFVRLSPTPKSSPDCHPSIRQGNNIFISIA